MQRRYRRNYSTADDYKKYSGKMRKFDVSELGRNRIAEI